MTQNSTTLGAVMAPFLTDLTLGTALVVALMDHPPTVIFLASPRVLVIGAPAVLHASLKKRLSSSAKGPGFCHPTLRLVLLIRRKFGRLEGNSSLQLPAQMKPRGASLGVYEEKVIWVLQKIWMKGIGGLRDQSRRIAAFLVSLPAFISIHRRANELPQ